MSSSAVMAAVRANKAEVGIANEPFIKQGVKEGFWTEPFLNVPKVLGPYAYSTLNVRLDSIKTDPAVVAKFVRGVIKGLKYTYADPEGATKIAKIEFPTMAAEDLKATLDRTFADELWSKDGTVSPEAWKTAAAVVLSAGILKQDVPYDDIIDMQFVKQNQASLP
jgi:NitT/TauT family transport system substrate-binding protein